MGGTQVRPLQKSQQAFEWGDLVEWVYLGFEKAFDKCPDLDFSENPKLSCIL